MSERVIKDDGEEGITLRGALQILTVVVSIVAALPTVWKLMVAIQEDVPFGKVGEYLEQARIIQRNWGCERNMAYATIVPRLTLSQDPLQINGAACPKTGDTHLRLLSPERGSRAEIWIPYEKLSEGDEKFKWTDLVVDLFKVSAVDLFNVSTAHAEPIGPKLSKPMIVAQVASDLKYLCKAWVEKKKVVQIVQENDKCFMEEVSPFSGKVSVRKPVSCDAKCPESTYKP